MGTQTIVVTVKRPESDEPKELKKFEELKKSVLDKIYFTTIRIFDPNTNQYNHIISHLMRADAERKLASEKISQQERDAAKAVLKQPTFQFVTVPEEPQAKEVTFQVLFESDNRAATTAWGMFRDDLSNGVSGVTVSYCSPLRAQHAA